MLKRLKVPTLRRFAPGVGFYRHRFSCHSVARNLLAVREVAEECLSDTCYAAHDGKRMSGGSQVRLDNNSRATLPPFAQADRHKQSIRDHALETAALCASFGVDPWREPLTADLHKCLADINAVLDGFSCEAAVQKARASLQQQVFDQANWDGQVFLLNMPSGSGKTLASMKFALERAIKQGKRRSIYIIPYNSIIDQTAKTLEKSIGEHAAILRHQSSYDCETQTDLNEEDELSLKQAAENWDAQIILTTAVQFFGSVCSNKRSKLRKLHNMAQSVLIFDEAHLMPPEYLQPCLQAITHLVKFLGSEALFLTATMPDFAQLFSLQKDYPGLQNVPPQRRVILISTSLIEVGVDVDFALVCRELNGLDNILQAGGRCNREGSLA